MVFYLKVRFLCFFGLLFVFFSCNSEKKSTKEIDKELVFYSPSEMAGFMNSMYAYNQQLKSNIVNKDFTLIPNLNLETLHSAKMTEGKARTEGWNKNVYKFINSQEAILKDTIIVNVINRYNTAINNCISCHKTECVGPLPRIKKLLINE